MTNATLLSCLDQTAAQHGWRAWSTPTTRIYTLGATDVSVVTRPHSIRTDMAAGIWRRGQIDNRPAAEAYTPAEVEAWLAAGDHDA